MKCRSSPTCQNGSATPSKARTAIASLHKHLLTARADLRRPGRPLGAFLLAGPSGVGKTETVLQLAELLYGGRQYLTTINMSEFGRNIPSRD